MEGQLINNYVGTRYVCDVVPASCQQEQESIIRWPRISDKLARSTNIDAEAVTAIHANSCGGYGQDQPLRVPVRSGSGIQTLMRATSSLLQ